MNSNLKDIMEILFNIIYLALLWPLVFKMFKKSKNTNSKDYKFTKILAWSFAFLALGDTGHVGFRVIAYLNGGLAANASLVGLGKFATSITLTIFYSLLIVACTIHFNEKFNFFTTILFISAIVRIIILMFPQNNWGSLTAPFNWTMYRNIPFIILGLGADYLILKNAFKSNDTTFKWIGIMILISFGFYIPVILFAHKIPSIGMLMIPKTIAYLLAAFIAYNGIKKY